MPCVSTQLPQIQEDEVTVIGNIEPLQYAISHFVADLYFNNASIFNGKLGQKLFSEKLNLTINRDPEKQLNLPFFDAEGVVNDGYTKHIVKNGVLTTLLTCKNPQHSTTPKISVRLRHSTTAFPPSE